MGEGLEENQNKTILFVLIFLFCSLLLLLLRDIKYKVGELIGGENRGEVQGKEMMLKVYKTFLIKNNNKMSFIIKIKFNL